MRHRITAFTVIPTMAIILLILSSLVFGDNSTDIDFITGCAFPENGGRDNGGDNHCSCNACRCLFYKISSFHVSIL